MGEMDKDMDAIVEILARELGQQAEYVKNVVQLLDEGNTIPFIARYRKELHGAMDDTTLRNLETKLRYLRSLQERREEVLRAMESQGKLTPALRRAVEAAGTLAEVEDLYRPLPPQAPDPGHCGPRKGLEPLAAELFRQDGRAPHSSGKGIHKPGAGSGDGGGGAGRASDILAEEISTMQPFARICGSSWPGGQCSPPGRPLRRPTVYTGCTMTSPVPPPSSRVIRSWPSTAGEKGGLPEALPGPAWGARPPWCAATP